MQDYTNDIVELIRRTSSDLPADVERQLRSAVEKEEPGSAARGALETILKNVELSRKNSSPICQDTGTPIFNVKHPAGMSTRAPKKADPHCACGGNPEILYAPQRGGCSL